MIICHHRYAHEHNSSQIQCPLLAHSGPSAQVTCPLRARSGHLSRFRELSAGEAFKYVNYQIEWEDDFFSLFELF